MRDKKKMRELMDEQAKTLLTGNKNSDDIFSTIALPMIRKTTNSLVSPNLVSVQPLSAPSGLVFYMDMVGGDKTIKQPEEPKESEFDKFYDENYED